MPSPFPLPCKARDQSRPMDHDNEASVEFKTTLTKDTVDEFRRLFDPNTTNNVYKNSTEKSPMPESVKVQQESAAADKFLDSTHYIEKRERIFRADLKSLVYFNDAQCKKYNLQKIVDPVSQEEHVIFQSQKLSKAQKDCSARVSEILAIVENNYKLGDPTKLPKIQKILEIAYETITALGEVESNVLGLSRGQVETKCALENLQLDMKSQQDNLVNTMVQFSVHNGEDVTHDEMHAKMESMRQDIVKNSIIHDPQSFEENIDFTTNLIDRHAFDRNQVSKQKQIFNAETELKRHTKTFPKDEINKVRNDNKGITGHIVPRG